MIVLAVVDILGDEKEGGRGEREGYGSYYMGKKGDIKSRLPVQPLSPPMGSLKWLQAKRRYRYQSTWYRMLPIPLMLSYLSCMAIDTDRCNCRIKISNGLKIKFYVIFQIPWNAKTNTIWSCEFGQVRTDYHLAYTVEVYHRYHTVSVLG
jgi:hypothetical protein